jgi:hypothetical protein
VFLVDVIIASNLNQNADHMPEIVEHHDPEVVQEKHPKIND